MADYKRPSRINGYPTNRSSCQLFLSWWNWSVRIVVAFRAFIVRGLFILYAVLAVWAVVQVERSYKLWLLLLTILPLIVELFIEIFTIWKVPPARMKTKGLKWFSPVIVLFLCCACPPIWFGELYLHRQAVDRNSSTHYEYFNKETKQMTTLQSTQNKTDPTVVDVIGKAASTFEQMHPEDRFKVLEQMLLLALICGRWLLPRGSITRDQLSQLLLVNIGMAADILELFEAFKEDVVRTNLLLVIIILSLWQASLLQFSLTKTATKARKIRGGFALSENMTVPQPGEDPIKSGCLFCETELWAICTSLALQDAPFLTMRMTLIFKYNVLSYSNVFFTCKNTLVLLLQIFRMIVICLENRNKTDENQPVGEHISRGLSLAEMSDYRVLRTTSFPEVESLQNALNTTQQTQTHYVLQKSRIRNLRLPYSQSEIHSLSTVPSCTTSPDLNASKSSTKNCQINPACTSDESVSGTAPRIVLRAAYKRRMQSQDSHPHLKQEERSLSPISVQIAQDYQPMNVLDRSINHSSTTVRMQ